MLELFIREEGRLLTETQLLEHTWGSTSYDEGASDPLPPTQEAQLVWTYVSYLRKKMQGAGQPTGASSERGRISSDGGGR